MKTQDEQAKDYEKMLGIVERMFKLPEAPKDELIELTRMLEYYHHKRLETKEVLLEIIQRPATLKWFGIIILIAVCAIVAPHRLEQLLNALS